MSAVSTASRVNPFRFLDLDALGALMGEFSVKSLLTFGETCKEARQHTKACMHHFDLSRIEVGEYAFSRQTPLHRMDDGKRYVRVPKPDCIVEEYEIARAFGISVTLVRALAPRQWPIMALSSTRVNVRVNCFDAFAVLCALVQRTGWKSAARSQAARIALENKIASKQAERRKKLDAKLAKSDLVSRLQRDTCLHVLESVVFQTPHRLRPPYLPREVRIYLYDSVITPRVALSDALEGLLRWIAENDEVFKVSTCDGLWKTTRPFAASWRGGAR